MIYESCFWFWMKGCIKYVTRQRVRTESKQQIKGKSKVIKSSTQNMQHILPGEALLSSSRVPEGEILERVEHSLHRQDSGFLLPPTAIISPCCGLNNRNLWEMTYLLFTWVFPKDTMPSICLTILYFPFSLSQRQGVEAANMLRKEFWEDTWDKHSWIWDLRGSLTFLLG